MKAFDLLFGRPSAITGVLWSFGLHATAFAATYAWWSSPLAPVSFAGKRHVMQLDTAFSEALPEQDMAAVLKSPTIPPRDKLSPIDLPRVDHELTIAVPASDLAGIGDQNVELDGTIRVESLQSAVPRDKLDETKPVEDAVRPPQQSKQRAAPQTVAAVDQFAGVDDHVPPDLSGNRPPRYPQAAIRRRLEGVVLLRLTIAVSGNVERVEIVKSSGHAILDRTAAEAVNLWRARPARRNDKPVATVELLPVHFKLSRAAN